MLSQHSLEGYSRIPTLIQQKKQNNQFDFENLQNLKYQIKLPKYAIDFPYMEKNYYHFYKFEFCETLEDSYKQSSKWNFSSWDRYTIKHSPSVINYFPGHGLLQSEYWYWRRSVYNISQEFFAYQLHPEDVNFDSDFQKENRIKLTIVFNHIQYITINAFDFMMVGDTLNILLKYPLWSKIYSFTVYDNLYEFDLPDFMLQIKYFVKHNILHNDSIILIQKLPEKRGLCC